MIALRLPAFAESQTPFVARLRSMRTDVEGDADAHVGAVGRLAGRIVWVAAGAVAERTELGGGAVGVGNALAGVGGSGCDEEGSEGDANRQHGGPLRRQGGDATPFASAVPNVAELLREDKAP